MYKCTNIITIYTCLKSKYIIGDCYCFCPSSHPPSPPLGAVSPPCPALCTRQGCRRRAESRPCCNLIKQLYIIIICFGKGSMVMIHHGTCVQLHTFPLIQPLPLTSISSYVSEASANFIVTPVRNSLQSTAEHHCRRLGSRFKVV